MFGQITDLPSPEALRQNVSYVAKKFDINEKELLSASESVEIKDYEQIMAAAKICEACVSYIMLNDILAKTEDMIIKEAERYVERIYYLIRKYNKNSDKPYELSASIGFEFCREGMDLLVCMHEADKKMYAIKSAKKNSRKD